MLDDLDPGAFDTDSEEELVEKNCSQPFPRIQLVPEEDKKLGKIDELEEEQMPATVKALSNKQAQRLSKFFEPSAFQKFGDLVNQGILSYSTFS